MKVKSLIGRASFIADGVSYHHLDVEFVTENLDDATKTNFYLQEAYRHNKDICFGSSIPTPEKIFRCGDTTTVIWVDGTKTIVKLMPGADDSDYGAFTAALAKKIYGNNSKVMKYAGMVQRVKSKAEKKAERKAKHKAESENQGEKKYIVSQYGQVAECKGIETEEMGVGGKSIVYAESVEDAKKKANSDFKRSLNTYMVYSNGKVELDNTTYLAHFFGNWTASTLYDDAYFTVVYAKSQEEALKIFEINPAPIPF